MEVDGHTPERVFENLLSRLNRRQALRRAAVRAAAAAGAVLVAGSAGALLLRTG